MEDHAAGALPALRGPSLTCYRACHFIAFSSARAVNRADSRSLHRSRDCRLLPETEQRTAQKLTVIEEEMETMAAPALDAASLSPLEGYDLAWVRGLLMECCVTE
jgi:hypothetical protein